jgi:hypothetical protein
VVFVAALVVVIVATHGIFVAGTWAWYDTSVAIQNNDPGLAAAPSATAAASEAPSASPVDESSAEPDIIIGPTPEATLTRPPNPNRITFLLIGLDMMAGRDNSATDTMMLVSIDTSTEKVSMVSVPRDTSNFKLYFGGGVGPTFKLNSLWTRAIGSDPTIR